MNQRYIFIFFLAISLILSGCSSSKFLSGGQSVLSHVELRSTDKNVKASDYRKYVRQESNARWFNLVKVPLGIYCLSGKDSAKWHNRFFRKIGEAPVIYDSLSTALSGKNLVQALHNKGYIHASVDISTKQKKKKKKLTYTLKPGMVYRVTSIHYKIDHQEIDSLVRSDSASSYLWRGMPCDVNILDRERNRIVLHLQNAGYYKIHKEFITFQADTCADSKEVDLTVSIQKIAGAADSVMAYKPYRIRKIILVNESEGEHIISDEERDSVIRRNTVIYYSNKLKIRPSLLLDNLSFSQGELFNEQKVQQTYANLSALPFLKYTSIRMNEVDKDTALLDYTVYTRNNKINAVSAELDGTNTAGDLGAAISLSFINRNIFKGSDIFSIKLRGAYEAIKGLEGYNDQNYFEISTELNLKFPYFVMPFLTRNFRRAVKVSSEFSVMYDSQNRPEFHRRVLTGAWSYRWRKQPSKIQHRLDLFSLNYVFMPWISDTFRKNYLDSVSSHNAILRYSYENLLIMRLGYNFTYNSAGNSSPTGLHNNNAYQVRFNVETAGNLLYGISKLFNASKNEEGQYTFFNIAYAQYAKFDFDFTKSFLIDERNSVAFHAGFGVVVPYGNASIVPYEKRYFSGGANSVRGWSVRGLGPGSFSGKDGTIDFINQTGNIKLDLSLEYRTFLFWKLHGAAFIDAGNIWTIRAYEEQPGGQFQLKKFPEQIAVSYGLGFRLNFDYFIIRLDMAMKAINPAYSDPIGHYPIIHPRFSRDFTAHFAVGLPF